MNHHPNNIPRIFAGIVAIVLAGPDVHAASVAVDGGKEFQVIHGFGTCQARGKENPKDGSTDPVYKWAASPEAGRLYGEELRMALFRMPLNPFVLEGDNPYKAPATVTDAMKADPAKITADVFAWDITVRGRQPLKSQLELVNTYAKSAPGIKLIASVWSPPHWMKEPAEKGPGKKLEWSQFGFNTCGGRLSPKYYTHFAHYLAAWSEGIKKKTGLDLYAVSIQNELSFFEPYDSCVYTPAEFAAVVAEVGRVFKARRIQTLIMGPEDMTKFPDRQMSFVKAAMKDPDAARALAIICSHGYSDGIESSLDSADSETLARMMQDVCPGKEYWMTETGGEGGGWDDFETTWDKGAKKGQKRLVKGSLSGFATMLHNAFVHGNASVWCLWQFLDTSEGCRSGLVEPTADKLVPTKKFYIQKHYSRFVPAGARRVAADPANEGEITASAYVHRAKKTLAIVLQNHGAAPVEVSLALKGVPESAQLAFYVTDAARNCEAQPGVPVQGGACKVNLPARSIATLANAQ